MQTRKVEEPDQVTWTGRRPHYPPSKEEEGKSQMARKQLSASDIKGKVDYGIITIREDEFKAVIDRLRSRTTVSGKMNLYEYARIEMNNGDRVGVAVVCCLQKGEGQSQGVTHSMPTWKTYYFVGHCHDGLEFLTNKFFAYIADDGIHWDYVKQFNEARPPSTFGPILVTEKDKKRDKAHKYWLEIPEKNRAWLEVRRVVLYKNIIAIDEEGDNIYHQTPHIYVPFRTIDGPFEPYYFPCLKQFKSYGHRVEPKDDNRIKFFLEDFPDEESSERINQPDLGENTVSG